MASDSGDGVLSFDAEPEAEPSPVRRGRMLGRYVLCYELASGGMATVYLARADGPAGFGRLVALKLIHPHLAKQKDFVEMFLDEARIASRIVHPNVCSVFDFGQEGDTYFLAMDYLVGETVGRMTRAAWRNAEVRARPILPRIFARVIADACEGLHAAHESLSDDGKLLGIVHRDVTPHNLFLGYDGSVRVVDFGVALSVERSHHTTVGVLKGKYPYMAPEQIEQSASVDRRADVWSLGVCLWEMLAGRKLFRRDKEYETLKAVLDEPILAPSVVQPAVPKELDPIVLKALARDRNERYASARELGRDLASVIGQLGGATAADVAELMDELFAAERAERALLIDRARRVDPEQPSTSKIAPVPTRGGGLSNESDTASGAAPVAAPPRPRPPPPPPPPPKRTAEETLPVRTAAAEPAPPDRRPLYAALGIAGVLAIALVGVLAVSFSSGGDATRTDAPPVSAPSAPLTTVAAPVPPPPPTTTVVAPPPSPPPSSAPTAPEHGAHAASHDEDHEHGSHRPPRTSTSAPSGAPGTVNVVTPPGWAEIFVRGARVGRSPTAITLPAGTTTVRLVPYGTGAPIERSVTVEPGGTTRLVVRLEAPAP
ncbi:MAG: serine/threonine-protein kinase [Sandaracinus sp.]